MIRYPLVVEWTLRLRNVNLPRFAAARIPRPNEGLLQGASSYDQGHLFGAGALGEIP
jgi:hypothetical protein